MWTFVPARVLQKYAVLTCAAMQAATEAKLINEYLRDELRSESEYEDAYANVIEL